MMVTPPAIMTPTLLERGVLVVTILAIAGGLAAFLPNGQVLGRPQTEVMQIVEAGDSAKQLLLGVVYLLNLVLLFRYVRPWAWRFLGLPLLLLVVWAFVSTAWSVIPDGTIRRASALAGTVMVGLYLGLRYDERRLTQALATAAALSAGGSVVWAALSPPGAFDADGHLRGVFYHKNAFGLFLALTILTVLFRIIVLKRDWRPNAVLLAALFGCLGLSHSATPIVATCAALVFLGVAAGLQRSRGLLLPIVIATTCLATIGLLLSLTGLADVVSEVLGRDPTFSGRTAIWDFVIPMIGKRPWFGYGYGIFWLGEDSPASLFWYWTKQFELHSHDGYLQLLLDEGVVGLGLFLASLFSLVRRSVGLNGAGEAVLPLWIAAFAGFFLVCNITDTELWVPNSLLSTLYVWAIVRVNVRSWAVGLSPVSPIHAPPQPTVRMPDAAWAGGRP